MYAVHWGLCNALGGLFSALEDMFSALEDIVSALGTSLVHWGISLVNWGEYHECIGGNIMNALEDVSTVVEHPSELKISSSTNHGTP